MKSIRTKLLAYFLVVIVAITLICGVLVTDATNRVLKDNIELTSSQTVNETLKGFQTYLRTMSQPIDLLTRKNEIKHLEDQGDFDANVIAIQDSLVASLKVVDSPVRCYYATKTGHMIEAHLYEEDGKVKSSKNYEKGVDSTNKEWYTLCQGSPKRLGVFATFAGPYIDEESGTKIITISQEITDSEKNNYGAVALDIDFSALENYVQNIGLLNTGYVLVVDKSGKVVVSNEKDTISNGDVSGFDFWTKATTTVEGEDAQPETSFVQKINGKTWYISILEDEITGWRLLGIVSEDEIASCILNITQSMIIGSAIGAIIGIIIALLVAINMSKSIKGIQVAMHRVANGDLTQSIKQDRKDELGQLQGNFNDMTKEISELIRGVEDKSNSIVNVAARISSVSDETKDNTKTVMQAINSVAMGATEQAQSTQQALGEVENLAQRLNDTKNHVDNINGMSTETGELSQKGVQMVNLLITKADETIDKSKITMDVMKQVLDSVGKINYISDAIADITNQTNLLSLNASIEAARAGEAGRGFAVVADEIRQLAEQSKKSTDEIKAIVSEVITKSNEAETAMNENNDLIKQQQEAILETQKVFENITASVVSLINGLGVISDLNKDMEKNKEAVLGDMENIASVSKESANSSEAVTASADQVNVTMESIVVYTNELNAIAKELTDAIGNFKL